MIMNGSGELESVAGWDDPRTVFCLELQTKGHEDFTIIEKAPTLGTFPSWKRLLLELTHFLESMLLGSMLINRPSFFAYDQLSLEALPSTMHSYTLDAWADSRLVMLSHPPSNGPTLINIANKNNICDGINTNKLTVFRVIETEKCHSTFLTSPQVATIPL